MNAWNWLVRAASTGALVTRDRKKESAEYGRKAPPVDVADPVGPLVIVGAGVEVPVFGCVPVVGVVVEEAALWAACTAGCWALCRAAHDFDQRASEREFPAEVPWLEADGEPASTATARTRRATSPARDIWPVRPDRRRWGAA